MLVSSTGNRDSAKRRRDAGAAPATSSRPGTARGAAGEAGHRGGRQRIAVRLNDEAGYSGETKEEFAGTRVTGAAIAGIVRA
ncbi:hypothetical protein [Burkholderia plantarii]|uniref:hypothetical protein n=1 Tax=Burkholderia plantarii TaxID=41899 RepID=UPI0018DB2CAE|nr:hypothetical protein [Burkholderia plantarii]MBI0327215.1 hypothetical protein [Burkholderia plantarii]